MNRKKMSCCVSDKESDPSSPRRCSLGCDQERLGRIRMLLTAVSSREYFDNMPNAPCVDSPKPRRPIHGYHSRSSSDSSDRVLRI